MDLTNNAVFQAVFLSCGGLGIIFSLIVLIFLRKKKINIYKKHRLFKIALVSLPMILLPVYIHPELSILAKLEITFTILIGGFLVYITVDKSGEKFRTFLGYETKWDKEETEFSKLENKENHRQD